MRWSFGRFPEKWTLSAALLLSCGGRGSSTGLEYSDGGDASFEATPTPAAGGESIGTGGLPATGGKTQTEEGSGGFGNAASLGGASGESFPYGDLDPEDVYIFGTLRPATACLDVLAHWSDPWAAAMGFDCYSKPLGIEPSSGRLVHSVDEEIYEFVVDDYPVDSDYDRSERAHEPIANDIHVGTTCIDLPPILSPDAGQYVEHCCDDSCDYKWADGTAFASGLGDNEIHRMGYQNTALLRDAKAWLNDSEYRLSILDSEGNLKEVTGEYPTIVAAARAHEEGFRLLGLSKDPATGDVVQLYHVDLGGTSSLIHTYSPAPVRADVRVVCALAASDDFFCMSQDRDRNVNDLIVRGTRNGSTEIIYDELDDPIVQLHTGALVTGP